MNPMNSSSTPPRVPAGRVPLPAPIDPPYLCPGCDRRLGFNSRCACS